MSAAEALLQLARSFGAAGKAYTDLTYSDEFVAAYEAAEAEGGGRIDRATKEGFEAAYLAGRREWRLAGGWKTAWTTSPESYDGMGTETAEGPFPWLGKQLRRVVVDPAHYNWQTGRYEVDWAEDPREVEAKIQATLAREKLEREVGKARYAGGLFWLRDLDDAALESADDFEDKFFDELSTRGLTWNDLRAEQRSRCEKRAAAERAAKWAVCRAAFKDGDTLVDDGAPSRAGQYGFRIPGRDPAVYRAVTVKQHYDLRHRDDPDEAEVRTVDERVGSLENVAGRIARAELRVARPDEVFPPKAVVDRLRVPWKDVFRAPSGVWIGRPLFGSKLVVLDDDAHLVRKKAVVEAALVAYREKMFGGGVVSRRKRIGANLPLARLHAQMALLCQAESDRIAVPHQWPPRPALSASERAEVDHLDALGREAAGRVLQLAPDRVGAFADFAFGYDAEPGRPS